MTVDPRTPSSPSSSPQNSRDDQRPRPRNDAAATVDTVPVDAAAPVEPSRREVAMQGSDVVELSRREAAMQPSTMQPSTMQPSTMRPSAMRPSAMRPSAMMVRPASTQRSTADAPSAPAPLLFADAQPSLLALPAASVEAEAEAPPRLTTWDAITGTASLTADAPKPSPSAPPSSPSFAAELLPQTFAAEPLPPPSTRPSANLAPPRPTPMLRPSTATADVGIAAEIADEFAAGIKFLATMAEESSDGVKLIDPVDAPDVFDAIIASLRHIEAGTYEPSREGDRWAHLRFMPHPPYSDPRDGAPRLLPSAEASDSAAAAAAARQREIDEQKAEQIRSAPMLKGEWEREPVLRAMSCLELYAVIARTRQQIEWVMDNIRDRRIRDITIGQLQEGINLVNRIAREKGCATAAGSVGELRVLEAQQHKEQRVLEQEKKEEQLKAILEPGYVNYRTYRSVLNAFPTPQELLTDKMTDAELRHIEQALLSTLRSISGGKAVANALRLRSRLLLDKIKEESENRQNKILRDEFLSQIPRNLAHAKTSTILDWLIKGIRLGAENDPQTQFLIHELMRRAFSAYIKQAAATQAYRELDRKMRRGEMPTREEYAALRELMNNRDYHECDWIRDFVNNEIRLGEIEPGLAPAPLPHTHPTWPSPPFGEGDTISRLIHYLNQNVGRRLWMPASNSEGDSFGILQLLRYFAGLIQVGFSVPLILAPELASTIIGFALFAHGFDTMVAGLKSLESAQDIPTLVHTAFANAARELGADDETAESIGWWGDLAVGLADLGLAGWKIIGVRKLPSNNVEVKFSDNAGRRGTAVVRQADIANAAASNRLKELFIFSLSGKKWIPDPALGDLPLKNFELLREEHAKWHLTFFDRTPPPVPPGSTPPKARIDPYTGHIEIYDKSDIGAWAEELCHWKQLKKQNWLGKTEAEIGTGSIQWLEMDVEKMLAEIGFIKIDANISQSDAAKMLFGD